MMQKTVTQTHTVSFSECDLHGTWKPAAVMQAAQDISGHHADVLRCGNDELAQRGMIWMLLRQRYHFERYPRAGEAVTVTTWPGVPRATFPRYLTFSDESGAQTGAASTLWVLVDRDTHKIINPQKSGLVFPDTSDLVVPLDPPGKIERPGGSGAQTQRRVCYSDSDIHRHMNNARYMEWVCDALDPGRFETHFIGDFTLHYMHEAALGALLTLETFETQDGFYVFGAQEQTPVFAASGSLKWK